MRAILCILFFGAGFSTIGYQVVWQRVLSQEVGLDTISTTYIITIFMLGLGIGAMLSSRLLGWGGRYVILAFAVAELIIGLFALFAVPAIRYWNGLFASTIVPDFVALDFLAQSVLLVPPVVLMGMTTPLVIAVGAEKFQSIGLSVGILYGSNVMGAAFGSLAAGYWMIENFGLSVASRICGSIEIAIGLIFFAVFWGGRDKLTESLTQTRLRPVWQQWLPALCFGFITLSLELVYFRILASFFSLHSHLFAVLLTAFLVNMSIGQIFGGILVSRYANKIDQLISGALMLTGILVLVGLNVPNSWFEAIGVSPKLLDERFPLKALVFVSLYMVSIVPASALFPLMVVKITNNRSEVGQVAGLILACSTFGNVIGAFFTGIFLFEWTGSIGAVALSLTVGTLGLAVLCGWNSIHSKMSAAVVLIVAISLPYDFYNQPYHGRVPEKVIEGYSSVAFLWRKTPESPFLKIDPLWSGGASTPTALDGAVRNFRGNSLVDLMVVNPDLQPKRILLIGLGNGLFPYAAVHLPGVERIDVVELSGEVIQGFLENAHPLVVETYADKRINIIEMDGRRFVQRALSNPLKYDIIQVGVMHPNRAGTSNLYTTEFFGDLKSLLSPEGYLVSRNNAGIVRVGMEHMKHMFGLKFVTNSWVIFSDRDPKDTPRFFNLNPELRRLMLARHPNHLKEGYAVSDRPLRPVGIEIIPTGIANDVVLSTDDRLPFEYSLSIIGTDEHTNMLKNVYTRISQVT